MLSTARQIISMAVNHIHTSEDLRDKLTPILHYRMRREFYRIVLQLVGSSILQIFRYIDNIPKVSIDCVSPFHKKKRTLVFDTTEDSAFCFVKELLGQWYRGSTSPSSLGFPSISIKLQLYDVDEVILSVQEIGELCFFLRKIDWLTFNIQPVTIPSRLSQHSNTTDTCCWEYDVFLYYCCTLYRCIKYADLKGESMDSFCSLVQTRWNIYVANSYLNINIIDDTSATQHLKTQVRELLISINEDLYGESTSKFDGNPRVRSKSSCRYAQTRLTFCGFSSVPPTLLDALVSILYMYMCWNNYFVYLILIL